MNSNVIQFSSNFDSRSDSMFSHIDQYDSLNSFSSLNELIQNGRVKSIVQLEPIEHRKQIRHDVHYDSFNDSNIMVAIQNDSRFLHFMMSIKHVKTSVYMYAEGVNYLVFLLSMNERYPVCVAKFPIEYPTIIQRNISDVLFSFPIGVVTNYITKTDKSSNQYSLVIKNVESNVVLEYSSTLDKVVSQSDLLVRVPKQETLDIVYFDKIKVLDMFIGELVGVKNTNHIEMINNMRVLMISNCRDFNQISKDKNIDFAIQTLDINQDRIELKIRLNVNRSNITISERSDSIFWSSHLHPMELNMYQYSSIFKSVDKIKSKSDNCYYLICNYKSFEHAETYMLVKVITHLDLTQLIIDEGVTFGQLFNEGFLMYELYFCYGNKIENDQNKIDCQEFIEDVDDYDCNFDW